MKGLTPEEQRDLIVSVGTHRNTRRLTPVEVAILINRSIEAGSSRQECAESIRIGATQISTFLRLLYLSPELQHLSTWGKSDLIGIAFSSLAELSRLPPLDQVPAAEAAIKHEFTWKEIIQLVQMSTRSNMPIDDHINAVLGLRPDIESRHVIIGAITDALLQAELERHTQAERNRYLSKVLGMDPYRREGIRGALGSNRFTLVSDRNLPDSTGLSPDELEERINGELIDVMGLE